MNRNFYLINFILFILSFVLVSPLSSSKEIIKIFPREKFLKLKGDPDSFYLDEYDYSRFVGRITDRDLSGKIIKIKVEVNNIKFFRAGDFITFKKVEGTTGECSGNVKDLENYYLVLYVNNISECLKENGEEYLRMGTILEMKSEILRERIIYAFHFKKILEHNKRDLLKQLNNINNFLWNQKQSELKIISKYEKMIIEIEKQKGLALLKFKDVKEEKVFLQRKIKDRLKEVDDSLKLYKIEPIEYFVDPAKVDHDFGLPVRGEFMKSAGVDL